MTLTVIGIAISAIIGLWIFGGVALRVGGAIFAFVGLVSLITLANPAALIMVVLGCAMWLAGHWHYALRHHEYKSPLAQRIFLQVLPPRYDPTRRWGLPVPSDGVGRDAAATGLTDEEEPGSVASGRHPTEGVSGH
jgi:hypothetical protein